MFFAFFFIFALGEYLTQLKHCCPAVLMASLAGQKFSILSA
jgi:hypothetical protein